MNSMKTIMENWRRQVLKEQEDVTIEKIKNSSSQVAELIKDLGSIKTNKEALKTLMQIFNSDPEIKAAMKDLVVAKKSLPVEEGLIDDLMTKGMAAAEKLKEIPAVKTLIKYKPQILALGLVGTKIAAGDYNDFSDPEFLKTITSLAAKSSSSSANAVQEIITSL
tara:strand:+ start:1027 stop:1521 length:495 start_codon:yes stop_codon:yes gene_type:complete